MNYVERTFVMIKPCAIEKRIVGEIIKRIERVGLRIIAMKMKWLKKDFVEKFYPNDEEWFRTIGERAKKSFLEQGLDIKKYYGTEDVVEMGKVVKKWLVNYIISGPVVGMVIEGNEAINIIRKLCGKTYPDRALAGTIRGDFSSESVESANRGGRAIHNIIHASGNEKESRNEINLWFKKHEIINYSGE